MIKYIFYPVFEGFWLCSHNSMFTSACSYIGLMGIKKIQEIKEVSTFKDMHMIMKNRNWVHLNFPLCFFLFLVFFLEKLCNSENILKKGINNISPILHIWAILLNIREYLKIFPSSKIILHCSFSLNNYECLLFPHF